jgi:hypothetical protein
VKLLTHEVKHYCRAEKSQRRSLEAILKRKFAANSSLHAEDIHCSPLKRMRDESTASIDVNLLKDAALRSSMTRDAYDEVEQSFSAFSDFLICLQSTQYKSKVSHPTLLPLIFFFFFFFFF